jgi:uncharacterized membrane protein YfhO
MIFLGFYYPIMFE